jgi:hypothetical protein
MAEKKAAAKALLETAVDRYVDRHLMWSKIAEHICENLSNTDEAKVFGECEDLAQEVFDLTTHLHFHAFLNEWEPSECQLVQIKKEDES